MKIKMLKTAMGSNTGAIVDKFEEGKVYDVSDDLALCFMEDKVAVEAKGKAEVKLPGVE